MTDTAAQPDLAYSQAVLESHQAHMRAHVARYGAPLGELRTPPTQEQLDASLAAFTGQQAPAKPKQTQAKATATKKVTSAKKRPPRQIQ